MNITSSQQAEQGFKVDISRGERIGRVSSEWFSRPDDERYLSSPPPWAERMQRKQAFQHGVSTAAHSVRSGDHGGGSMSVSLNQDDRR